MPTALSAFCEHGCSQVRMNPSMITCKNTTCPKVFGDNRATYFHRRDRRGPQRICRETSFFATLCVLCGEKSVPPLYIPDYYSIRKFLYMNLEEAVTLAWCIVFNVMCLTSGEYDKLSRTFGTAQLPVSSRQANISKLSAITTIPAITP